MSLFGSVEAASMWLSQLRQRSGGFVSEFWEARISSDSQAVIVVIEILHIIIVLLERCSAPPSNGKQWHRQRRKQCKFLDILVKNELGAFFKSFVCEAK